VGAVVSTVTVYAGLAVPVLPAASATCTFRLWTPEASAGVVKVHVVPVTTAWPSKVLPS
jgi:hypothetical protein